MGTIRKITQAEWEKVDEIVAKYLREDPVFKKIPIKPAPKGKHVIRYVRAKDMAITEIGEDFFYRERNRPIREEFTAKVAYLTKPVFVKRTEIDASSSTPLTSLLASAEIEARAAFMEDIENTVFHGQPEYCSDSEGMCNYTGREQYGSDGSKALTTFGNFAVQMQGALSAIRDDHIKPPYIVFWTPGIPRELAGNWASGVYNELEQVKKTYDSSIISDWVETDAIVDATLSTSNQVFMVAKLGAEFGYISEVYPIHRDGIDKPFDSDVAYALRTALTYIPKQSKAVCVVTGLTTTSAY